VGNGDGGAVLLIDHYIAKSTIHGLGVYSAEHVAKGQKVWEFHPVIDRIVSASALAKMPQYIIALIDSRAEYLPAQDAHLTSLDGDQFTNHSDDPNICKVGEVWLASREIRPGDELTCDYRETVIRGFDPETRQPHSRMSAD
jgi:uncharacterized protein